ncbi:MAG TPA: nuclear transport factor 2 family protein [Nitrolancea sp.]|nr:nuclear transport factor 2 family protein [Nitrolancea sp.]
MSAAANMLSVIEHFINAWNDHDADGVLECFADDAVITIVPALPTMPDAYAGKPQIRGFVQANMPDFSVAARDYEVMGNTVTWLASVSSTGPWRLGLTPITAMAEAVLHHDKIRSLTIILSEESVARLLTAWNARNRAR